MGRLPIGVKALEHIEQYALIIVHLVHDMMYCCNYMTFSTPFLAVRKLIPCPNRRTYYFFTSNISHL